MTASVHATELLLFSILVQLIIMIGAARLLNLAFRRMGQPGVIGEIVAGLLLGPSLFGHFFPELSVSLFGAKAAQPIVILSQIGLILLMFQIGSEFEFGHLKTPKNRRAMVWVSLLSITVPFGLGFAIGQMSQPVLAPGINALVYSLFCGVALAITAVPILGRILREFGLTRDEMGVVAISSAAVNDVVGWILLALISAYAASRLSTAHVGIQLGGLAGLGLVLWFVLRPAVDWLLKRFPIVDGQIPPTLMAIVIILTFALGITTYKLGIFAIFGGFAAGLLFHKHEDFVVAWRQQVGQFVLVFFLPIFFTFTGLRTNLLGLGLGDLGWLGVILAAAILGKIIPVYFGARIAGFDHPRSMVLGTLMNTRALMELIVLNIGYDMGFLPQKVFTMLVIMAVVTTVMTGPLLKWLLPKTGHVAPRQVEA
ncbi:cation:proton antiporter [Brevundimonas goettingensis]|uniref:Cation:proton antiporter n=1 Tax=Brevundimonas goettingensis TaxID=2774190 RepID=A0A975GWV4_9CAUL|nr:cation:proton antiporter [Brevundimonas goettingensis]QTC92273.1 cation:proton antiporter [Brevundimonas goettingensis]